MHKSLGLNFYIEILTEWLTSDLFFSKQNIFLLYSNNYYKIIRIVTQPGRPGEPGKVTEFDIWSKSQGNSAFYPKFWKKLRLEAIIMQTLKLNFWISYIGFIKWSIFSLFITSSQFLVTASYNWNVFNIFKLYNFYRMCVKYQWC